MKILLLSDVHANPWALEAVLSAEKYFDLLCCAGDLVDWGTAPSQVISRLRQFSNMRIVCGNHDGYAIHVFRHNEYPALPELYRWLHYNAERMTEEEIKYLERIPAHQYFFADGWAYLMQHYYVPETYEQIETVSQFETFWREHTPKEYWNAPKKRMIFGHTHRQCIHQLGEHMEWINPGSISYRKYGDFPQPGAYYMTIQDGEVNFHSVSYDETSLFQEVAVQLYSKGVLQSDIRLFFTLFGNEKMFYDLLKRE